MDYRAILQKHGIVCSTSRTGNYYDNAAMERWFSTFEAELGETFESIGRGKDAAFDYIEDVLQPATSSLVHRLHRSGGT